MKLALAAACLAASSLIAGAAFAGGPTTATLEQPVAKKVTFIAASAVWTCEGSTCVTGYAPDESYGVTECKVVAKKAGRITEFRDNGRPAMATDQLEKCNANALNQGQVTAQR